MGKVTEALQKIKNGTTIWSKPISGYIFKGNKKREYQRDICTHMFISTLFTMVKTWKQPKYLSKDEWIKKMWCIHNIS